MIDRLRQEPATSTTIGVFGFDPDQDTIGWGLLLASIEKPARGPAPIVQMQFGLIEHKVKGTPLEQVEAVISAAAKWVAPAFVTDKTALFVEGQQVYANEDEAPRKRVAKANDLLRLAQVTGAIQMSGYQAGLDHVQAVLPVAWKGNGSKGSTVAELQERLAHVTIIMHRTGHPPQQLHAAALDKLPGKLGHALDGVGIALWGLDFLALHGIPGAKS